MSTPPTASLPRALVQPRQTAAGGPNGGMPTRRVPVGWMGRAALMALMDLVAPLALLVLAGCAAPQPSAAPELAVPAAFAGAAGAVRNAAPGPNAANLANAESPAPIPVPARPPAPGAPWWQAFGDPQLDALMARAALGNTSLQQAAARVDQARAAWHAAGAGRAPQLGGQAGASRQGGPLLNAAGSQGSLITLGVHLDQEVDLFGRLSALEQAAVLDLQSREALLQGARLWMQTDIVQTRLALRALDQERALAQDDLQAQRAAQALVEHRRQAGLAPEQEVARARSETAAVAVEVLALERRRNLLQHTLAFLCGVPDADAASSLPAAADTAPDTATDTAPLSLPEIPPGIPAQVLARRPDVQSAERAARAARQRLGASQAARWPALSLTASGGLASPELSDLLKAASRGWGLGLLLSLPLFDGGRQEARIEAAAADVALADAAYREQVLQALREVEDQLSTLQGLAQEAAVLRSAQGEATRAADLARSRYASGLASLLEVLDAQHRARHDRRALVQAEAARQQATVALVRALGGGWDAPAAASAASPELNASAQAGTHASAHASAGPLTAN